MNIIKKYWEVIIILFIISFLLGFCDGLNII